MDRSSTTSPPRVLFSCVAENGPVWFRRVQNLVLSLRQLGGSLAQAQFVTNFVDNVEPQYRVALERLGADVRVVPRHPLFDRVPPSNKLRMFELAGTEEFDVLLALDCDLIIHGDLSAELSSREVRLQPDPVHCYTDMTWERIYHALDLDLPVERYAASGSGEVGFPYFNSGVIFTPRALCAPLLESWTDKIRRFTDLAISQPSLVPVRDQSDQPPLALALHSSAIPIDLLPLNLNLSTKRSKFAPSYSSQWGPPFIFHYHDRMTADGFVMVSPDRRVSPYLDSFNRIRSDELGIPYRGLGRLPIRQVIDNSFLREMTWYRALRTRYLKLRTKGRPPRRTTVRGRNGRFSGQEPPPTGERSE